LRVAGCGLRTNLESSVPAEAVQASFVLGLVDGASCDLYEIETTGPRAVPSYMGETENGVVSFGRIAYEGPALIECTGGTYLDEATGTTKTGPLTRAVVEVQIGGSFTVSPLTEIATRLALADATGVGSALTTHNSAVASAFGLEADITTTTPADIRNDILADDAAGKYATVLAIISQLDANVDADEGSDVDVVDELADILLNNEGSLDEEALVALSAAVQDLATSDVAELLNDEILSAIAVDVGITNAAGALVITGDALVGSTLTATLTDADGTETSLVTYQWSADGADLQGATAATYLLTDAEKGSPVTVTASYVDDQGFAEELTSSPTAIVNSPNETGTIAVSGSSLLGSNLTAAVTDGNGTESSEITYQWAAEGVAIEGANSATYVLTLAYLGSDITVLASYDDGDGYSEAPISSAVTVTAPANQVGVVEITGTALVGSQLASNVTDGNGISSAISYQWSADGASIAGATESSYILTASEKGKAVTITASYSDASGYSESATSAATGIVNSPNLNGGVAITGDAAFEATLTANVTDGNGLTNATITYQWAANGSDIGGATAQTYQLTLAEVGLAITVSVTYTDDDGYAEAVTSSATEQVTAPGAELGVVTISGDALVGALLTASVADGNNTTTSTIAYQWAADDSDIAGATSSTYLLTQSEKGATITVTAVYQDDAGFSEDVTSDPTAAVNSPNQAGVADILGNASVGATLYASVTDGNGTSGSAFSYQWASSTGGAIGADAASYTLTGTELGDTISVTVVYTDDDGYAENVMSVSTSAVVAQPADIGGTIGAITNVDGNGNLVVGQSVTVAVDDANGIDFATPSYEWKTADASGDVLSTETNYIVGNDAVGEALYVEVTYTDDDGYTETLNQTTAGIVYTDIVTNGLDLNTAVDLAGANGLIGVDSPDSVDAYKDVVDFIMDDNKLVIEPMPGSTAEISGATCIVFSDDNTGMVIDGLVFDALTIGITQSCYTGGRNASILLDGNASGPASGNKVINSTFKGDLATRSTELAATDYNYISLGGTNNAVERNEFLGKYVDLDTNAGAAIVVLSDAVADQNQGNIVQYNLFKDFAQFEIVDDAVDTDAHAIKVGTSTGTDAVGTGDHEILYNRFDNLETAGAAISVHSSLNSITGNTLNLVEGGMSLLDGYGNTVNQNIFVGDGASNQITGILFSPLGHQITDNYATLTRRWFLGLTYEALANDGNAAIITDGAIDKVTVLASNTSWDARGPFAFSGADDGETVPTVFCSLYDASDAFSANLDVDRNLVLMANIGGGGVPNANSRNQRGVLDGDWVTAGCSLNAASDFDQNRLFVRSGYLSESGAFDFNGAAGDNTEGNHISDPTASGDMTDPADDTDGPGVLVGGTNNAGVDLDDLDYADETDVGPDSTWVFGI
jgi:hypothetical protein